MRLRLGMFVGVVLGALVRAALAAEPAAAPPPAPNPAAADAGTVETAEDLSSAWIIPAGRDAALVEFIGDWWKAPRGDVKADGLSADRDRVVLAVKVGSASGKVVVAHGQDPRAFPAGVSVVERPSGAALKVGVSCDGCAPEAAKGLATVAGTWAAEADARRDGVWAARPAARETPEPGSIEKIPQGKSEDETRFEPTGDPTGEGQETVAGDGGLSSSARDPGASRRPWGRYLLLASLVLLLVWLLRTPAEETKPAAGGEGSGSSPAAGTAGEAAPTAEATAPKDPPERSSGT